MVFKKDLSLQKDWVELLYKLKSITGKRPADVNAVLYLIGLQELGKGPQTFTKEEKQDIIHIAICKVLSLAGFYELEGMDKEGWPHWRKTQKIPNFDVLEQEKLLKMQILEYFKEEINL